MTTIETERLLLRPWSDSDLDGLTRICADHEVMRHIGAGRPFTRSESAAQLAHLMRHWEEHGFGLWAATDRGTGALAGMCGLAIPFFLPAVLPAVEVGWRFGREHWDRGLATEGGFAGLRHAAQTLGLERVISIIRPENAASLRVAEKLGLAPEGELRDPRDGRPMRIFATDLDAWRAPGV